VSVLPAPTSALSNDCVHAHLRIARRRHRDRALRYLARRVSSEGHSVVRSAVAVGNNASGRQSLARPDIRIVERLRPRGRVARSQRTAGKRRFAVRTGLAVVHLRIARRRHRDRTLFYVGGCI